MPEFKLVDQAGTWLTNIPLGVPDWKPGDRIHRGPGDTLEVIEVRADEDMRPGCSTEGVGRSVGPGGSPALPIPRTSSAGGSPSALTPELPIATKATGAGTRWSSGRV